LHIEDALQLVCPGEHTPGNIKGRRGMGQCKL
jgi:hypothetical protein